MSDTVLGTDQSPNGAKTTDDVFGDLEAKTVEAIADAVDYRRRHGLPIAIDRGDGVEVLS
ncbi:MAG TPA: hypothetical protein VN786_05350 [Acidimicrobiales bacterium]|jgi:hypothetical protein|nr:hypothetical protein [Acidimicrobiales bacterium]